MLTRVGFRLTTVFLVLLFIYSISLTSQYIDLFNSLWSVLVLKSVPIFALFCCTLICLQFKRSRYIIAIFWLALLFFYFPIINNTSNNFAFAALAITSLNLFWLSLGRDSSLFSPAGFLRLGFIALQVVLIGLAFYYQHPSLTLLNALSKQLISDTGVNITQAVLAGIMLTQAILVLVFHNNSQRAFLAMQACLLLIAFHLTSELDIILPLLFIALTVLLIVSTLFDSFDMAYRDELTGVASRRALNHLLLGLGRRYTIAMADIDHFKQFNDRYGHDVGDDVLRMVAARLNKVSGGGKLYRYGGEEFTVVFPGKSIEQAKPHLEVLRQNIEQYVMKQRQKNRPKDGKKGKASRKQSRSNTDSLSVTVSFGIAQREGKQKTPEQVIKAADNALYKAKKAGRNCIKP